MPQLIPTPPHHMPVHRFSSLHFQDAFSECSFSPVLPWLILNYQNLKLWGTQSSFVELLFSTHSLGDHVEVHGLNYYLYTTLPDFQPGTLQHSTLIHPIVF